jgi:phosphatidylinositol glycan class V
MSPSMWGTSKIPGLLDSPVKSLVGLFVAWKSLLLLVACCSPGPGYDTSTGLYQPHADGVEDSGIIALLSFVSDKLTRWDAIYFSKIANRGYLFEQEWAFGWGFTRLISLFSEGMSKAWN